MADYTEIENKLINRISEKALRTSLVQIRDSVETIWRAETPRIIQNYTDHGFEHCLRLIEYVSQLLDTNKELLLSDDEIYLLIAGIYLHDIGMQCDVSRFPIIKNKAIEFGADFKIEFTSTNASNYSLDEQIEIRKNHHLLSAAWIDTAVREPLTPLGKSIQSVPKELILDLLDVCKNHSKLDISKCSLQFKIKTKGRKQLIATLLRFSDELDIAKSRVSIDTVLNFTIEPKNQYYWWLHNLTNIDISGNVLTLLVSLHPNDFDTYKHFIKESYINNFISKNQTVIDILNNNQIPISISVKSEVILYEYALELPTEIKNVIREMQEFSKVDVESKNSELTLKNNSKKIFNIDDEVSIDKVFEVLNQEVKSLNFSSTKEDIAKILNLRTKIQEEYFKTIETQLDFIVSKSELLYASALFDSIYTSTTLNRVTESEIENIRIDVDDKFKWYDRSILVSGLTLSLINFKFDQKKANLLLDFVIDSESKVWERALTGLIIAILYQKNRSWLNAQNFIHRLQTLQNDVKIQEGIKAIDFILKNELYKACLFNPNIFKLELFKNPMNCFVPFFENNKILKTALNGAENGFDVEEFMTFLNEVPLMDSNKYAFCVVLSEGHLKDGKDSNNKEFSNKIAYSLFISDNISPYQNLISEFFCFYNYFPEKKVDDLFEKQLLLTKTKLKDIVLNKTMQLLLAANTLLNEEKYPEAISKYKDLLKINKTHKEARWQLANCYCKKYELKKALAIYLELEKEFVDDLDLLYRIALCYGQLKKFDKSIEYCNRIEKKEKNPSFELLLTKAESYDELEDYSNASKYCKKAEEKVTTYEDMYQVAVVYYYINQLDDALRLAEKIRKTKGEDAKYLRLLGGIYCDQFLWEMSIQALEKAETLDKKDDIVQLNLGRSLLLSKIDVKKARLAFEKVIKFNKNNTLGIAFGNLGHLYLIEGNLDLAIENYIKCIEIIKDEKEFKRRMVSDLKFIVRLGIEESNYSEIINKVIQNYNVTRSETINKESRVHLHGN